MNEFKPSKILAVGSVNGKFQSFFEKITKINQKNGPFDVLLVTGEFFGDSEDIEVKNLVSGNIKVPISTYIIQAEREFPSRVQLKIQDLDTGGEICENIFYLGKAGIFQTLQGVRIAYISGTEFSEDNEIDKSFTYNAEDIQKMIKTCSNTSSNLSSEILTHSTNSSKPNIDILLSYLWPSKVQKNSSIELQDKITSQSLLIKQLCEELKPRYAFAGKGDVFYEREPFKYTDTLKVGPETGTDLTNTIHFTRFLGLGSFESEKKTRWFYAMNLTPLNFMNGGKAAPSLLPPNTTECPFENADYKKRDREQADPGNMFWSHNENQQRPLKVPHKGYVCRICNQPGHFITDCSQRNNRNNSGDQRYQQPGNETISKSDIQIRCWFCLANPDINKRLIVSVGDDVYLAMAKGGLIPKKNEISKENPSGKEDHEDYLVPGGGHVLIIPIEHVNNLYSNPENINNAAKKDQENIEKINKESEKYIRIISLLYGDYDCVPVTFELCRANDFHHTFTQVVPVPKDRLSNVREMFLATGNADNLSWSNTHKLEDSKQGYFKVSIPDGKAPLITSFSRGQRFDLQFGRRVLALVLGIENGEDWKDCVLSDDLESKMSKSFSSALNQAKSRYELENK
ncbi:hypothetical protein BB559_004422 [Furculomyces boomerangus]|uniref:CCHC-type domain-containing protein n=1 Tax=Furculomyces boomerangus TaxID=61424 RepID=A0A2T9YEP7_9FUNG|nr:hypothetical protein BB559_004422 [Furculomyces boomerangus]